MKLPTMESSFKAGMIYTGLKTILNSVGLEHNQILLSLVKYFSLCSAILELLEEEFSLLYPYASNYTKEILIKGFYYLKNDPNHHLYNEKITSLCSKDINNLTQEFQKKILNKICTEHNIGNYTKEHLFTTSHDNFKAICIILGDQELCSEVLL